MKSGLHKREQLESMDDKTLNEWFVAGLEATGYKTTKNFGYAQTGFKTFQLKDGYEIIAHWEKTRNGFRHIAILMKDGSEVDRAKATYQNRTWESYEYQSVINTLLNKTKILSEQEKKAFLQKGEMQAKKGKHYGKTKKYEPTNFITKNTLELPVQFSITIPSTRNIDESIGKKGLNERIKQINKWIIDRFYGDTTLKAKGDYDNKGKIINEDVGIIEVSTNKESYEKHKKELSRLIKDLREEYGQKQMAYSIEGNLFLYPENPEKTLFKKNPALNEKMLQK
jgi:hypothetical protein